MRRLTLALVALLAVARAASAQVRGPRFEMRPFAGAYVPTGRQSDAFGSAFTLGTQGAVDVTRSIAFVGNFAWIHGTDRLSVMGARVETFQYDAGLEVGLSRPVEAAFMLRPFVGLGGGARTYGYRDPDNATRTFATGHAALGTEFLVGRTALRLELRDYVSGYAAPGSTKSVTRNDVTYTLGFAWGF